MARRRRQGLGEGVACPLYRVRVVNTGAVVTFQAMSGDKKIGYVETLRKGKALKVELIGVDKVLRKCGVGTKLYEAAAAWGCAKGLTLTSDVLRTPASDGFWAKQVRKGRAKCAKRAEMDYLDVKLIERDPAAPVRARSGCSYYKLKNCDVAADLSGRRRRR